MSDASMSISPSFPYVVCHPRSQEIVNILEASNTTLTTVENEEHFAIGTVSGEIFDDSKMLPPPDKSFGSREELLDYIHDFSFTQGYATTIRDSEKEK